MMERAGRAVLAFTDPEGQRLELVDDTVAEEGCGCGAGSSLEEESGAERVGYSWSGGDYY